MIQHWGHDGGDTITLSIDFNRGAYDFRIRPEPALPQALGDYHHTVLAIDLFLAVKRNAENRLDVEHGENARRHTHAGDGLSGALSGEGELAGGKAGEQRERARHRPEVVEFYGRQRQSGEVELLDALR